MRRRGATAVVVAILLVLLGFAAFEFELAAGGNGSAADSSPAQWARTGTSRIPFVQPTFSPRILMVTPAHQSSRLHAASSSSGTATAASQPTGTGNATTSTRHGYQPTGTTSSRRTGNPLAGKTIVIDPGHQLGNSTHLAEINRLVNGGGFMKACNTTGTATNAGFPEATFTWDVALALRSRLQAEGATVVLTRHTNSYSDWGPCVDARGRLGNQVHADAAISIHGDGADATYHGFFVIMPGLRPGWTDDIYGSSHRLGVDVHAGLVGAGTTVANDYGGTGYSIRTDLGTLNWSNVPIVMVEMGNMRNATDAAHMTSASYRDDVYARGLADGLTAFLAGRGVP